MKKSNVFLEIIAVLLLIACIAVSGCVFQQIPETEETIEVPVFTLAPTPTPTPIVIATISPTSAPKSPGTFVGNWTRELPTSGFDETLEFKDEKSFTYTLLVTNEKIYNENNREIDESYIPNGFTTKYSGKAVQMSNGKYRLRVNYCAIFNEKGLVTTETKLSDTKMITLADFTYDKDLDSLVVSNNEQTTRFKRIS